MKLENKPINALLSQRDQELYFERQEGLTLLEYYAGKAMQGLLANPTTELVISSSSDKARWAIELAKDLIAELEKQQ